MTDYYPPFDAVQIVCEQSDYLDMDENEDIKIMSAAIRLISTINQWIDRVNAMEMKMHFPPKKEPMPLCFYIRDAVHRGGVQKAFYGETLSACSLICNDHWDYFSEVKGRFFESKANRQGYLVAQALIEIEINPLALKVGEGEKRRVFDLCKKNYPDEFSMTFKSFNNVWKEAKKNGFIST